MVLSRCGMRCDLCLVYRPNVEKEDRRAEIVEVFKKIFDSFEGDPETIICDGCTCQKEDPILLDPECQARKCVIEKGILHCGYCDNFPCSKFPAEPSDEVLKQKIDVEGLWTWEENALLEAYQCKKNMEEFKKCFVEGDGYDKIIL
ncbi:MAG: DUF3795 domain-containing protein [Eubacterium sp.]|nr:DUF3795 domain-containing protein [Eubacterium sp.]